MTWHEWCDSLIIDTWSVMDKEMLAYDKLRKKLIGISAGVSKSNTEFRFTVNASSTNHHYIPKFFIDGFLNDKGLLWCYDKINDRIKKNPKSSKGVFFEKNRNNININGAIHSFFEDAYTVSDNISPLAIKILRREAIDQQLFSELSHHFNVFLNNLYWRSPNVDLLIANIMRSLPNSHVPFNNLAPSKVASQQFRLQIEPMILEKISPLLPQQSYYTVSYPAATLCLGDMPLIFRQQPKEIDDLATLPLIAPVSGNRLFIRNISNNQFWDGTTTLLFNAISIDCSSRMIVCADKDILERSIRTYHNLKKENMLDYAMTRLFGDDLKKDR
jgi:Protein of unknown function (DUF4238)